LSLAGERLEYEPSTPMSSKRLPLLVVALLAVTAGCSFLGPNPDSYTSTHDYTVGLDVGASVTDVTIRVPAPQLDGAAAVDATTVAPNGTVDGAFDAELVETEYGPMLELTADSVSVQPRYYRFVEADGMGRREEISESEYEPSNPNHQKVDRRSVGITVTRPAEYPIETRTPVGAAPTFYADGAVTRELVACALPYGDESACFGYDAPVYLSYDTAGDAHVAGSVTFTGSNEWFTGGWTGNSYYDRVQFNATGSQDGWASGDGYTETGRGRYPAPEA
jgi:hypothetical protein